MQRKGLRKAQMLEQAGSAVLCVKCFAVRKILFLLLLIDQRFRTTFFNELFSKFLIYATLFKSKHRCLLRQKNKDKI